MIINIPEWSLFHCRTSEEADNYITTLCDFLSLKHYYEVHVVLTDASNLSDDLHHIIQYFNGYLGRKFNYIITSKVINDRPRIILKIRNLEKEVKE